MTRSAEQAAQMLQKRIAERNRRKREMVSGPMYVCPRCYELRDIEPPDGSRDPDCPKGNWVGSELGLPEVKE